MVSRARPGARNYTRFAAALYWALACADLLALLTNGPAATLVANAISLIVEALAPATLALAAISAFANPPKRFAASAAMVTGLLSGLFAAATGAAFVAMAALFASVCTMLVFAARRWRKDAPSALQSTVAGLALIASAAAGTTGGAESRTSLALFSGAALLGIALAVAKRSNPAVKQPAVLSDATRPSNVVALVRRQARADVGPVLAQHLTQYLRDER